MILVKGAAGGRKVIACIQIRVAQKLEDIAVKCVAARLGDDIDLAAAILAIFGIEIIGENSELGDGVQIGNDRSAHVDVFFDVAAIHHKAVGEFALAVNGNGAGIQVSRGREGDPIGRAKSALARQNLAEIVAYAIVHNDAVTSGVADVDVPGRWVDRKLL